MLAKRHWECHIFSQLFIMIIIVDINQAEDVKKKLGKRMQLWTTKCNKNKDILPENSIVDHDSLYI